ncbi:MAG: phospholipase A [Alcanivoracaceae bacterium]|nr:phospholipase A [Alcanivoracaceae bacterium]
MIRPLGTILLLALVAGGAARAEDSTALTGPQDTKEADTCLANAVRQAPDDTDARTLRAWCQEPSPSQRQRNEDALRARLALEEFTQFNPFVLTPHRRNYILPFTHWSNPQWNDPEREAANAPLDHMEAKLQLSLKLPIKDDLWGDSTLYGAFTMESFWQVYNHRLSRPFRETNYSPELFIATPLDRQLGPLSLELLAYGYEHESNGQDVPTSRSWDRLFVNIIFKTGDYYWSLRPWWRFPEEEKDSPLDRTGDDNPDIERYMGHFELTLARPFGNHVAEIMLRNNLRTDNKGAGQIEYSFPINSRVKGMLQVFTGYGDSLINYDDYQTRVGVGILLTDTL